MAINWLKLFLKAKACMLTFISFILQTYDGMIVGEHSRDTDLDVRRIYASHAIHSRLLFNDTNFFLKQINPVRAKELSNMRSANKDENVKLSPPRLVCNGKILDLLSLLFSQLGVSYPSSVDMAFCNSSWLGSEQLETSEGIIQVVH